jgi:hypothetical protein
MTRSLTILAGTPLPLREIICFFTLTAKCTKTLAEIWTSKLPEGGSSDESKRDSCLSIVMMSKEAESTMRERASLLSLSRSDTGGVPLLGKTIPFRGLVFKFM